jgi:hypothetical protein
LLGPGYSFSFVPELVEVNARGELAFTPFLSGPGLNNTNSAFVVAGLPNALRVIARSGQPVPGVSGAFFQSLSSGVFNNALIGSDGSVAFVASYTDTGNDYGLWVAPSNGSPRLVARSGAQAPGAPAGVVFTNSFQFLPPFEELYMNARNQIAFRANLGGPGVGSTNSVGIWLAEPDGTLNLVVRAGDTISTGGSRKLALVTLGQVGVPVVAGSEDGRASPLNDRGELLFAAYLENPSGQGLFIARSGIVLSGERAGNDIRISFPTISGKNYRADSSASLSPPSWSPLAASVPGTGGEVTVTDTNASPVEARFYRVVRLD